MADVAALLADLDAESEVLDALVSDLTDERVAGRDAGAGLDDRRPDRPSRLDRRDRDPRGHRRRRLRRSRRRRLARRRRRRSTTPPPTRRPARRRSCWRGGATAGRVSPPPSPTSRPGRSCPWFGPPMSAASMATARLMETWAHGQDVADALGVDRQPTDRLRHVAHIGVRARDYAYHVNGLDAARRGVPRRARRRRRATRGPGARTTPPSGSAGRPSTSACSSPSGATATTSPSPPRAATPSSG